MVGRRWIVKWGWLVGLLVLDVFFVIWWRGRDRTAAPGVPAAATVSPVAPMAPPLVFGFPTAQTNLAIGEDETVFMPTASGRVQSALYGSVRTQNSDGRILPSFHEGIDIAPQRRDRRGRALDPVLAVADGTVVYANRVIGHSNYGRYVVLEHVDPVGVIYTLYAHLNSISDKVRENGRVERGDELGLMGNTPASSIPVARSHLHFEIGMIQNRRFEAWARAQKMDNRHGRYHGWNLTGVDPLALYPDPEPLRSFSMTTYLAQLPVAFELLIRQRRPLDYFVRYPALWHGGGEPSGDLVLAVSEGGVVTHGRPASAKDLAQSGGRQTAVLFADSAVLGRNGLRLVVERGGRWELGRGGQRWLDILTH